MRRPRARPTHRRRPKVRAYPARPSDIRRSCTQRRDAGEARFCRVSAQARDASRAARLPAARPGRRPPRSGTSPHSPSSPAPRPLGGPTPPHILIAEDNPVNQKVARGALEKMRCTVDIVSNGAEAVDAWEHAAAIDLILMDCQMPVMDGYQATRDHSLARARRSAHSDLALTADAMSGTERGLPQRRNGRISHQAARSAAPGRVHRAISRQRRKPSRRPDAPCRDTAVAARRGDASPGDASPPVDWEQFVSLTDGDEEFAQQLVQLFIDSGDAALARDPRGARPRGSGRQSAAPRMPSKDRAPISTRRSASAAAARLEQAARAGALEQLAMLEQALRREAGRATDYLRARQA